MSLGSPWMLLLLVAVPALAAGYVAAVRRRSRRVAELAAQALVLIPSGRIGWRRHLPFGLFAAALTLLLVGLARPEVNLRAPRREGTVVLAFDVSNSMRAEDLEPNRLDAAKAAARAFVKRQPSTIRVGVVAFGDGALVVREPTTTQADVIAAIDRLSPGGGTSLGQALLTSLGAIAGGPLAIDGPDLESDSAEVDIGYFGSSTIVLLSDGENTSLPDPLSVAEVASVAGVAVHTVGIGTEDGAVVDVDGFKVATALDRELLADIASVTDGTYHQAAAADALQDIYRTIDLESTSKAERTEITALFAMGGLLLLAVGASSSVLWFGRVV